MNNDFLTNITIQRPLVGWIYARNSIVIGEGMKINADDSYKMKIRVGDNVMEKTMNEAEAFFLAKLFMEATIRPIDKEKDLS